MDIQKTTQCALHASRPSTSRRSLKSRPSALQYGLNSYIQMIVDNSARPPPRAIATISYSSMITHATPLFGSFQIRSGKHAPQPNNHFRPELTPWDTTWNSFSVKMAAENRTTRPSDWCSLLVVQHMNHVLPTLSMWIGCWTHDPDHHQESTIHDDWLPSATRFLGRSSQYCSLPPPANPKRRPEEKRWLRRLSSTILISIRDAACIWQALSRQWWR